MTPREAAISVLENAANKQGELLTRRQGQESIMSHLQREEQLHKAAIDWAKSMPASVTIYGKPPTKALQEFIDSLHAAGWNGTGDAQWENITRLWSKLFIEPVMAYHANKPLNITVDHDGDCNLLNGADGAGCNCTARERQKMQDRITELEAERNDFKRALDDLGVTPAEARKGAERSREKDKRIAELQQLHGPAIRLTELVPAAYFRGWADGARTGESDSPDWNAEEDWRETDIRRELLAMEEQTPSITIYDMTQLVCGELPENYQIHIHMEKGYGEAILYFPTQEPPYDGSLDGSTLADANIEKQIVELVKLAKGEPSEYAPEGA